MGLDVTHVCKKHFECSWKLETHNRGSSPLTVLVTISSKLIPPSWLFEHSCSKGDKRSCFCVTCDSHVCVCVQRCVLHPDWLSTAEQLQYIHVRIFDTCQASLMYLTSTSITHAASPSIHPSIALSIHLPSLPCPLGSPLPPPLSSQWQRWHPVRKSYLWSATNILRDKHTLWDWERERSRIIKRMRDESNVTDRERNTHLKKKYGLGNNLHVFIAHAGCIQVDPSSTCAALCFIGLSSEFRSVSFPQ